MKTFRLALVLLAAGGGGPETGSVRVPSERLPLRVHVFENFETDIEKRWWLAGVLETMNVPPGSRRSCRGTLSKDFDDKMGDPAARYTAVIFNPVPGPPMGKHPRLRFRYWLRGSDRIRVQIFSLTNNYHRRLELGGLPQRSWQAGSVDMTDLRRPDGSGGPLSEDERIDDIQFYVDRSAELIIDDIVLYDAALPEEREAFPSRILFTGWFDTGKQGQEWPGEFEIVPNEKREKGKAARSVQGRLRLSLRGLRPVNSQALRLRFRYRLSGAEEFSVCVQQGAKEGPPVRIEGKGEGWLEARIDVAVALPEIDAVLFRGAGTLLVDDLLVYVPGEVE